MKLDTTTTVGIVCGAMFGIVAIQAMFPSAPPVAPPPEPTQTCLGDSIPVSFPYQGWSEPHTCAVQCGDDQPRYILYSDGKAAQCETPPGCNDTGEDRGILCVPPLKSV